MKLLFLVLFSLSLTYVVAQGACPTIVTSGTATYFLPGPTTTCLFDTSTIGQKYGAINASQFGNADYCGVCLEVTGAASSSIIQIVDNCPTCVLNSLDLTPSAFLEITGALSVSIAPITWKQVSCPWITNLRLNKFNSNAWYCEIIIENHVNDLSEVQIFANGVWNSLNRTNYNTWKNDGIALNGEPTYTVSVKDIYGQVIQFVDINFNDTQTIFTASENFIPCENLGLTSTSASNLLLKETQDEWILSSDETMLNVQIFNQTGQCVEYIESATNEMSISKNNLSSGVYFIAIELSNGQKTVRKILR